MGLSEIASGLELRREQRDRGVATVDETDAPLADRLAPFTDRLPCDAATAARVLRAYAAGASVGRAGAVAGVSNTTAAKTLYLLGEPVDPLTPTARRVIEDWLAGSLSRSEARTLTGLGEREFALGVWVATHEPPDAAREIAAESLPVEPGEDPLTDARSDVCDLG